MKKNSIKALPTNEEVVLVVIFIVVFITFIVIGLALLKAPLKNVSLSITDSIKENKSTSLQFGGGKSGGGGASGTY